MANVTVDVAGSGPGKVLLGAHFDGKLLEGLRFVGANDGGSSAALLLELARCLVAHPPPCTVTLAFFDGEEALVEWSDRDSLYGSKNLALELRASGALREVRAMVLVDMIGDADLHLFRETLSTPWVQQILMEAALSAGHGELWSGPRGAIEDDHLPFLQSGVPAAVMIDLNYGPKGGGNDYWHTEEDTLDKLSPDSLQAVGETLLHALPKLCQGKRG
jgi:Zn-dependent M28 family amino/carboxypeptidase